MPTIIHHGAVHGVTGSCHELNIDNQAGVLVDCGMFQGAEIANGQGSHELEIDFPIEHIQALVLTHVHIDHSGRIPYLLATGFDGPILCSEATAKLLPLVLEDAIKMGITRDRRLAEQLLSRIEKQISPLPWRQWHKLPTTKGIDLAIKLKPAGHILGSAYVEVLARYRGQRHKTIFSGDLGAPWSPLLSAPKSPYSADVVVLESTYGDRLHEGRKARRKALKKIIEKALQNRGVILIPAFSIGRTQALLYELETLIHQNRNKPLRNNMDWDELEVILDSPLAGRLTRLYRNLSQHWDKEAQQRLRRQRKPLSFEQLLIIDDHQDHKNAVKYLEKPARPSIVIAASGMCTGGRVVNYLKALLGDPRHDILFVGYQAQGTPGRIIQKYGPRHGYVELDSNRYTINAAIHSLSGYSAHADQQNLINFIKRMRKPPTEIRLVHGDDEAKQALKTKLEAQCRETRVLIPQGTTNED
jgi:metallo-beta-lactamase family protein